MPVTLKCQYCGKSFQVKPYRKETAKFCSQECMGLYGHHVGGYFKRTDHEYLRGNQYRQGHRPSNAFQPGHEPWNKGLSVHLSPESQFEDGNRPANAVSVGTVRIRTRHSRNGQQRRWVKVSEPNVWRLCAKVVWEKAHGTIPSGHVIHHKDGDTLNDRIENLECLTRKEHLAVHRARQT